MERLHQLLHSLDMQQVKVLKSYLTGFSTRDPNTKFWELSDLLLSNHSKVPSIKACSLALYKCNPDGRIERLKNRLYVKVLDSLLIDINTNRDIYEDENHPIQIRLRKKMILFDLLKFTPLIITVGMEMINEIISVAKQYEFHSILLEAMYIYKSNYGLRRGPEFFQKVTNEIAFFEKCKLYAQRSQDLYTELGQFSTFNTKIDKNKLEKYLADSLAELKQYYLETKVKSVGYYLKNFEIALLELQNKIPEAIEAANSLLKYLEQNKPIRRKGRFGIAYGNISELEIQLGNYDSAIKNLYKAREFFPQSSLNLAISKKMEADILFLKGDYQKTKEIADSLANEESKVTGDFRRDMMLYYKGCCHFMLGEFRDAARMFSLKFQLTKDKLGWEVNIRFMRILAMIELNRPEEAAIMVDNVSQHIIRYYRIKDLKIRDRMLMSLFRQLAREGFAFHHPGDRTYKILLQLKETDKEHSWEPLTPELIPIHNYVINKYGKITPPVNRGGKGKKVYKTAARKGEE